jgi:hypothetical protein
MFTNLSTPRWSCVGLTRRELLQIGGGLFGLSLSKVMADEAGRPAGSLSTAEFDKLFRLIKPQPGESRWMEIAWYPNVWEARQKAAREGKPLFIWAGSGGAPAAGC